LTERHHIQEFSEGGDHFPENLILLCPNCHALVHKGEISKEELSKRRMELSGSTNRTSSCLSLDKEYLIIDAGGSRFVDCKNILVLNDIPIISAENRNGFLMITLRLFNERGELICWMMDNMWWVDNEKIWDFEFKKRGLTIFSGKKEILKVEIGKEVVKIRGEFFLLGDLVQLSDNNIFFRNKQNSIRGCVFKDIQNAIVIKEASFECNVGGGIVIPA